jgi:hypothetical protein
LDWGKWVLRKTALALGLFLALLCLGAQALSIGSPGTIIVQQGQKEFAVSITNDSASEQDFSLQFYTPFNTSVSPSSGKIGAGETAIAAITIPRQEELEGSAYNCLIEVRAGGEIASKEINVVFRAEEAAPQGGTENGGEEFPTGEIASFTTGLFSAASMAFTPENALNAVLALFAAILLIAFIARFVKRLEATK